MDWLEIIIETSARDQDVVANLLQEVSGRGVVIEDPALLEQYKNDGLWDAWEIPEASLPVDRVFIKAYLPMGDNLTFRVEEIRARLDALADFFAGTVQERPYYEFNSRDVKEEDWATAWKAYFKPVHVTPRIVVKPTWEEYPPAPGEIILELDPGMAFGTGTHSTTGMCLKALDKQVLAGQRVLDVGTGSGILAVAAAKLGAGEVLAVDIDETAVRVASKNVAQNGVEEKVTVRQGDLLSGVGKVGHPYHLVVANIIADVIIKMTPDIPKVLAPGGLFIASGIIDSRWSEVHERLLEYSLEPLEIMEDGGWVAVAARLGT